MNPKVRIVKLSTRFGRLLGFVLLEWTSMRSEIAPRGRFSSVLLFAAPFVVAVGVAVRPLRVPWVHEGLGVMLLSILLAAVWRVGGQALSPTSKARRLAWASILFQAPFLLTGLLWIGIATPWDATAEENCLRYQVLLVASLSVTCGVLLLEKELSERGDRFGSALMLAAGLLGGVGYLVWASLELGYWVTLTRTGQVPESLLALSDTRDTLLFVGSALTYSATLLMTVPLKGLGFLGRRSAIAYRIIASLLLGFLVVRGLSFPSPTDSTTPWFLRPGFVAGIPAVPWILPHLLAVSLLCRARDEARELEEPRARFVGT